MKAARAKKNNQQNLRMKKKREAVMKPSEIPPSQSIPGKSTATARRTTGLKRKANRTPEKRKGRMQQIAHQSKRRMMLKNPYQASKTEVVQG